MTKRIFALIICALMLLPIFAACDKNGDVPDGKTPAAVMRADYMIRNRK